jgi:hypothetical protein
MLKSPSALQAPSPVNPIREVLMLSVATALKTDCKEFLAQGNPPG